MPIPIPEFVQCMDTVARMRLENATRTERRSLEEWLTVIRSWPIGTRDEVDMALLDVLSCLEKNGWQYPALSLGYFPEGFDARLHAIQVLEHVAKGFLEARDHAKDLVDVAREDAEKAISARERIKAREAIKAAEIEMQRVNIRHAQTQEVLRAEQDRQARIKDVVSLEDEATEKKLEEARKLLRADLEKRSPAIPLDMGPDKGEGHG